MVAGADQVPAGADAAGRTAVWVMQQDARAPTRFQHFPAFSSGIQRVPAGSDIFAFAQLCSAQWPGALLVAGSDQVPAGSDAVEVPRGRSNVVKTSPIRKVSKLFPLLASRGNNIAYLFMCV